MKCFIDHFFLTKDFSISTLYFERQFNALHFIVKQPFKKKSESLGLVLSSGDYLGEAAAEGIKSIEEFGVTPDYLSGASVGALYTSEHKAEEILNFFEGIGCANLPKLCLSKARHN